jgi:hypothetical protein
MANALIAWDNAAIDNLGFISDGTWTYDASVENLARSSLALRWVSPGLADADTRFTCTVGNQFSVKCFALCSHNLSLAATVRVKAANNSAFSPSLYDSGAIAAFPAGVTEASRTGLRWNFVLPTGAGVAATFWRVEISDAANLDGRVSAARLFFGRGRWQPSINMLAGASLGWESNFDVQKAIGGAEWFTEAEAHRVAKFGLHSLPTNEVLSNAFDLQRCAAGSRREVIFQYDPADTVHAVRRTLFGRLRQLSVIEEPYYGYLQTGFEVKELI